MTPRDTLLFVLLAAIWGSSYIFMRVLAPILGPIPLACARTLIAGAFLAALLKILKTDMRWRRNLGRYLFIGACNTGIPFALLAFAAIRVPAYIPAIINALTPLWGAVFAAILLKDPFTRRKLAGFALGLAGVSFIALRGAAGQAAPLDPLAIAACVLSTILYGFAGAYIRGWASDIPSRTLTAANLAGAGLILLPFVFLAPSPAPVPLSAWAVTVGFALLCSAAAYLIYFHLMSTSGVIVALSVTIVQPLFTFLWGFIFLGEHVTILVVAGAVLTLAGTWLVIGGAKKGPGGLPPRRSATRKPTRP